MEKGQGVLGWKYLPVSLSRVSEGVKERKMAKIQWFGTGGLRTQSGTLDCLTHLKCLYSCGGVTPSLIFSSTLNMMAGQRNNYDTLENSFQSFAPVLFCCFFNSG